MKITIAELLKYLRQGRLSVSERERWLKLHWLLYDTWPVIETTPLNPDPSNSRETVSVWVVFGLMMSGVLVLTTLTPSGFVTETLCTVYVVKGS